MIIEVLKDARKPNKRYKYKIVYHTKLIIAIDRYIQDSES